MQDGARGRRAIATITLAFALDPVVRWIYQDTMDHLTHWPKFIEAYGEGAIASRAGHATEDFSGVALWLPPGISPDEDGVVELLHTAARTERGADIDAALEEMDAYHPTHTHYYLTLAWLREHDRRQIEPCPAGPQCRLSIQVAQTM